MHRIDAIIKRPDEKYGHKTAISPSLENLQRTVDGYIETVTLGDLVIICNEEGRLIGEEYNCQIGGIGFVGTIAVVGYEDDEFDNVPITFAKWKDIVDGICSFDPRTGKWENE